MGKRKNGRERIQPETIPTSQKQPVFYTCRREKRVFDQMDLDLDDEDDANCNVSTSSSSAATAVVATLERIPKLLFADMQSLGDASAVHQATAELAKLCRDKTKRGDAIQLGAHAIAMSAMKKWRLNSSIQAECCHLIRSLLHENDAAKLILLRMGIIEDIVVSMKNFPTSPVLHFHAFSVLATLFERPQNGKIANVAERYLNELHGLYLITNSMKLFKDCEDIQHMSCILLAALSSFPRLKPIIKQSSAARAVSTAIEKHSASQNIQTRGAEFMNVLFTDKNKKGYLYKRQKTFSSKTTKSGNKIGISVVYIE